MMARWRMLFLVTTLPLVACGGSDDSGTGSGGASSGGSSSGGGGSGGASSGGGGSGGSSAGGGGGGSGGTATGGGAGAGGGAAGSASGGSGGAGKGCEPRPEQDGQCAGKPPHFYACMQPDYTPPAGCELLNIGDATDTYCCP
jgi:hypothetical protein